METIRLLFGGVLEALEEDDLVVDVNVRTSQGREPTALNEWQTRHQAPAPLPDDLCALLSLYDGMHVSWRAKKPVDLKPITLGVMQLNSLVQIQPHPSTQWKQVPIEWNERVISLPNSPGPCFTLASLPHTQGARTACLVYTGKSYSIWFHVAGKETWYYLSDCVTDFFRIMVVHRGITDWCDAYTEQGLAPLTRAWLSMFAKEALLLHDKKEEPRLLAKQRLHESLHALPPHRDESDSRPEARRQWTEAQYSQTLSFLNNADGLV